MVLKNGALLALAGVAIGLAAAFLLARLISALLFQTSATDPPTFSLVPLLLLVVALLACWLPARRASRVDPMVALRYE
jgi:putative ABC transport system permease protein